MSSSANRIAHNQISERNPSIELEERKMIRSLLYNYKIKVNDSELPIAEIISIHLEVDLSDALKSSPALLLIVEIFCRYRNLQNIFNL